MSNPEETPPAEPNAVLVPSGVAVDIRTHGPLIRERLVDGGHPTDVIDFAMGLVGNSPNHEAFALLLIQALNERLDTPPDDGRINNGVMYDAEGNFTDEMDNDEEFSDWYFGLDESHPEVYKLMSDEGMDEDGGDLNEEEDADEAAGNDAEADYEEGDDELTDDDDNEGEDDEVVAAPRPRSPRRFPGTDQTFGVGAPTVVAAGAAPRPWSPRRHPAFGNMTDQTFGVGTPTVVAAGARDETDRLANLRRRLPRAEDAAGGIVITDRTSRRLAQAEDSAEGIVITDPTSYRDPRDRSRSPIDDGTSRD